MLFYPMLVKNNSKAYKVKCKENKQNVLEYFIVLKSATIGAKKMAVSKARIMAIKKSKINNTNVPGKKFRSNKSSLAKFLWKSC